MHRLAWLLFVAVLAGCAEQGQGPWIRWEPLDQDPGARAGARDGVMMGPGGPIKGR